MTTKFEITMTNKWLYSLIAVGVLLTLVVGVWAYNLDMQAGNPAVMGHSAGEINVEYSGQIISLQDALNQLNNQNTETSANLQNALNELNKQNNTLNELNNQSKWTYLNETVLESIKSSWTSLDLSSYVGARPALVLFRYEAVDTSIPQNHHSIAIKNSNTDKPVKFNSLPTGPGAGVSEGQAVTNGIIYLVMATDKFGKVEIKGYSNSKDHLYIEGYI